MKCSSLQDGETPLYIACKNGHAAVVAKLIAAKADVNIQDKVGIVAFIIQLNILVLDSLLKSK